ncbi:hypothetical protein OIDMADRAFT_184834 [Oidiodendron maius Zn]|uniref:Protein kinase domain-containing protein n=1 Tax=Oidiodendron maius (strain Zn) TaxID=913774 RepID=A0A0C3GNN7_OIDMZ|nr:hypothetical protein OIDMADRAFT_184834 [Oidiodendron maius Zn]
MDRVFLGQIQRCLIQIQDPESLDRSIATFVKDDIEEQVWIEWKSYPHTSKAVPEACVQRAVVLIEQLKGRVPHLPHLMGWVDDYDTNGDGETRIGFVFKIPPKSQWAAPTSLHSLLEQAGNFRPSVEARNALAYSLYHTIRCLHFISLHHGDLRSNNVIYYNTFNATEVDYTGYYISGFALPLPPLRPDDTLCPSLDGDNLYRHPNDQEFYPIFKRDFDLYSLGVVLVEIAYWKPICKVLGVEPIRGRNPKFTQTVRDLLLEDSQLTKLSDVVGNSYAKLVQMFLKGLGESWNDSFVTLLEDLRTKGEGGCKSDVS